jgi:hypothetical protein
MICAVPALSPAQTESDVRSRLRSITKAFDEREALESATQAHAEWLRSPSGKSDIEFLTAHYNELPSMLVFEMPTELARTGAPEVVPFLRMALSRPGGQSALSGIFFACHFTNPPKEFGAGIAPSLVPLIGKGFISSQDRAVELLPILDPDFAQRTLFTDEYLSPDSRSAHFVLEAFNDVGITIPMQFVRNLIAAWEMPVKNKDAEYRLIRGYRAAIVALATHDPAGSFKRFESWTADHPDDSDTLSVVFLAAKGLTRLYEVLCNLADEPAEFQKLPKPAQIYFALSYWEGDLQNGGAGQALGNSTGNLLPLIKEGYQAIGDTRGMRFLEVMCQPFGPEGPSPDRERRNQQMEQMKPTYWEREDSLYEAWAKEVHNMPSAPTTIYLLNQYAAKHADVLRPLIPAR